MPEISRLEEIANKRRYDLSVGNRYKETHQYKLNTPDVLSDGPQGDNFGKDTNIEIDATGSKDDILQRIALEKGNKYNKIHPYKSPL